MIVTVQILKTMGNKIRFTALLLFIALFCCSLKLSGQYPVNYQYTILPASIIDEIIAASSGEQAMHHINNLAPYTRPRNASEFPDKLSEAVYIMERLNEYGIKDHSLDNVGKTTTWRGIEGTVTEVSPGASELADFNDVPEMLAEGSRNTNLRAQLVWVGAGDPSFFADKGATLKGKIAVTSGSLGSVHGRAMNAGALGTISIYNGRELTDQVQIPNGGIYSNGFGFFLPPREGALLRDRLLRNEKIEVAVKVRTANESVNLLVPQCIIAGSDTAAGEIIITAHLFEGYVKMGANDNMSGSAVILEAARLLNRLITEGKIPKPVRGIRFLWVPEFSGTIPWVNMHLQQVKKAICNINLDMVGLNLRENKSFMCFNRSGYSTSTWANDVMENIYRFTGETNMEGITDDLGRRGFSKRIVAPTGTDDPFYYRIVSLYGSSDNAVFNDWRINVPGLKMNTWPDNYYHSSEDNPDKCDPTQLRRAVFITAASAYTLALADDQMAQRIVSEVFTSATTRLGIQAGKSNDMVWKSEKENIPVNYKRAVYNLQGSAMAEIAALDKIRQISVQPQVITLMNSRKQRIDDQLQLQLASLREVMTSRCKTLGIAPVELKPDEAEKAAAKIIPVPTQKERTMGSASRNFLSEVTAEFRKENPFGAIVNTDEAAGLANGSRNLLDIKKMVDAQFERESPLQDIINYYKVLKQAGLMQY
jgi:aminopeptidase YwaD